MDPLFVAGLRVVLGGRTALDDVTLTGRAGEVLGVLGANGGGKTTLLRAALGLARLQDGQAWLGGRSVATLGDVARSRLAGYLPQDRRVGWNLPAWRLAALGRPWLPAGRARALALEALESVGVGHLAERGVLDMSGGERARVLLARLLATQAPLLVADEPAAGLDPDAQFLVMGALRRAAGQGAAVVVSLHDLTLAARSCDRIAVLAQGRLIALGAPEKSLAPAVLREAFGLDGGLVDSPFGPVVSARRAV